MQLHRVTYWTKDDAEEYCLTDPENNDSESECDLLGNDVPNQEVGESKPCS